MTVQTNVQLKPFNTFGIEAKAKYFVEISTIEELQNILQNPDYQSIERLVLGGGSNLLLTKDFDGLVIRICIKGFEVIKENDDSIWIKSGAGVVWHDLVMYCVNQNYAGMENLSLIPGTVGAAPMQNIGAYGIEIKEVFEELEAIEIATGKISTFDKSYTAHSPRAK